MAGGILRLLREELARGSSLNLGFTVVTLAVQLVAGLLLAAYLGPQGVGTFAVGMLVLETTMVFVHLPGVAFVREFASDERRDALATVAAVKLALCAPAMASIALLAGPLAGFLGVPPAMILWLALYPPVSAVSSIATMVFESRRDMLRRNVPGLTENAARLAAVVALVAGLSPLPTRPESAALAWVLGAVPAALVSFALAGFPDVRAMHPTKAREYFSFGWRTTVAQLLQKELMWVGTAAVYLAYLGAGFARAQDLSGLFKVAYSLMFYIVLFGSAVATMAYPMFSRAFALPTEAARVAEAHRLLSLAFYYELLISVPLAAGLALGAPLAFSAVLPAFAPAAPYAQALALSGVLFCLTLPPAVLLPAANRPGLILRLFAIQATVAAVLNAALVPQTGAWWGGPWGAVIADWATAGAGCVYAYALVAAVGVPPPSLALARKALAGPPDARAPPRA